MPEQSQSTGFSRNALNRMGNLREDAGFLNARRTAPDTRFLVLSGEIPALKHVDGAHDALFTVGEADALGQAIDTVFLGCHGERALFARLIEATSHDNAQERAELSFIDLRTVATQGLLAEEVVGALAQAKSLLYWHRHNGFCANCGKATRASVGGSRRECEACGRHHFPKLEPVVIMLVTDGERCLLGRQARFPPGMYSCLAGFTEVGETLEDSVRREIMEEAGIRVGAVRYLASQPWPFPSSLMLGCLAQADSTDITVDTTELEDARWFSREEARLMLSRSHPGGLTCPPKLAIANLLIRNWALDGLAAA